MTRGEIENCAECGHEHVCIDVEGRKVCEPCSEGKLCARDLPELLANVDIVYPEYGAMKNDPSRVFRF